MKDYFLKPQLAVKQKFSLSNALRSVFLYGEMYVLPSSTSESVTYYLNDPFRQFPIFSILRLFLGGGQNFPRVLTLLSYLRT